MVRVQLSSNFQVVELHFDSMKNVNPYEIMEATNLVNQLGKNVINDIKTTQTCKKSTAKLDVKETSEEVEMASEKQIECLTKFGRMDIEDAKKLTKQEANALIKERMAAK